jgi:hypothetical protein
MLTAVFLSASDAATAGATSGHLVAAAAVGLLVENFLSLQMLSACSVLLCASAAEVL